MAWAAWASEAAKAKIGVAKMAMKINISGEEKYQ
jgi:hypothetical protein